MKDKDGNPIPVPPENGETFTYDPTANTWYTCTREREVYSFDMAVDRSWQYEFKYPSYEGGHHDGLEFVNGFLWISDMTANWIGQWRKNPDGSWEEIARFYYDNPVEDDVEGMGFGPLGHLWVTGWNRLYEIGGKELGEVIKGIELAMALDKTVYDPKEIMDIHLKITDKEECCTFPITMAEIEIKIDDKNVNIEDGRIDKAIEWAKNKLYSHDYDGYCWRFVVHAYKKQNGADWTLSPQGSAKQAANSLEPLKTGAPPRGALAFYDSVEAPEDGHVGLSLGDTDNDGKTEIIHAYSKKDGVIISDDYDNIGGCTYIGWTWPPIKIIYANKEYLIKAKAPSENGDHTVWVQVVTDLGSADDIKSFSVSGEVPSGTVSVSQIGNVDDATKDWKFPTKYEAAVFRRGIDNPTFILTLDNQLSASYEGLFEVYSPNDANTPIGSCKSSMCLISNDGFGSIWRWTDTNGNPLYKDQIPVGIYTVKGSLVNINDPSDKKDINSCNFYVIFDFERMDDGAFTTRCNSGFRQEGYLPKVELHQYDPQIWGRAIARTSGSTTVLDAIDKLSVLTRIINGDSTYHHLGDNERTIFSHDGYDNNFNGIIDDDDENWDHQYEVAGGRIYIKDLTTFFLGLRVKTEWLLESDGVYSSEPVL